MEISKKRKVSNPPKESWDSRLIVEFQSILEHQREKVSKNDTLLVHESIRVQGVNYLGSALLKAVPEEAQDNDTIGFILQYSKMLEHIVFSQYYTKEYFEYARRMKSFIFHATILCRYIFDYGPSILAHFDAPRFLEMAIEHSPNSDKIYNGDKVPNPFDRKENIVAKIKQLRLGFQYEIEKIFPLADVKCKNPKCKSTNVVLYTFQKRGADEPADEKVIFSHCTKCPSMCARTVASSLTVPFKTVRIQKCIVSCQ
jgi:DNA-directed RNA polymerase subunit M/transcription elongation factor TFIIS